VLRLPGPAKAAASEISLDLSGGSPWRRLVGMRSF
jgi:hypothetical protein